MSRLPISSISKDRKLSRFSLSRDDVGSSAIRSAGELIKALPPPHPLLLPHTEVGRRFDPVALLNHQGAEECAGLVPPLRIAASRKRARQSDIVDGIKIRDEIETLENAANVVCSKLVSLFGGHLVQSLAQYGNVSTGTRQ